MARPSLPLGTFGDISTKKIGTDPDVWYADARYRPADGKTRQMRRTGPTENKAKAALKQALGERLGSKNSTVGGTRFRDLVPAYLDRIQRSRNATTYDRYVSRLKNHVLPGMGELHLRECTAGRFKAVIDELEIGGLGPAARRGVRTVMSGVMQEAVDAELIDANPIRTMRSIKGGRRKKAVAYDAAQLVDFLSRLDGDKRARRADMPDFIRMLFGVGVRFGEVVGLRWQDLNLSDQPVVVDDAWGDKVTVPAHGIWVNGNIVDVRGRGLVRNDGKTFTAQRTIVMPDFLHMLLLVRRPVGATRDEPVFPSQTGGWRHPSNVQRSVRRTRARIGYPKFTTHVGRKTVATALDQAGHTAREIAAILGHARPSMTQDTYMAKGEANPAAARSLNRFHGAQAG